VINGVDPITVDLEVESPVDTVVRGGSDPFVLVKEARFGVCVYL
jgi:hypothetical protein